MAVVFKKNIFLSAVFFTLMFSVIVFSVILLYENNQRDKLFDSYLELEQKLILEDVYSDYMIANPDANFKCDIMKKQMSNLFSMNDSLSRKFGQVRESLTSQNNLKYIYVLTNLKLLLHYNRLNDECDADKKIIIYFYPETKDYNGSLAAKLDVESEKFESKLTIMKNELNVGVLAFPYQKNIPILDQLISDYNIVNSPAIVFEDDIYYDISQIE